MSLCLYYEKISETVLEKNVTKDNTYLYHNYIRNNPIQLKIKGQPCLFIYQRPLKQLHSQELYLWKKLLKKILIYFNAKTWAATNFINIFDQPIMATNLKMVRPYRVLLPRLKSKLRNRLAWTGLFKECEGKVLSSTDLIISIQ